MKALSSGVFWGVALILIGSGWVLNNTLGLDIPVFQVVISLMLIYLGISIITGHNGNARKTHTIAFGEEAIQLDDAHGKYSVSFGAGKFELTDKIKPPATIEIDVNFGGVQLYIDKNTPVKVIADAAFGGVEMPSGKDVAFGHGEYTNPAFTSDKEHIIIKIHVAFGGCEIHDN